MLLGIDLGTSSLKVMLFDPQDGTFTLDKEPVVMAQPAPDRAEGDPEEWWAALVTVLQRLRAADPGRLRAVKAIGVSTFFPVLVPLDAAGRVLHPALLYCDHRSVAQVEELAASFGRTRLEQRTGNQLTPGTCTLPGILWLRAHEPELFRKTRCFAQATTFLTHRLTGEFTVDYSHGSLSGMVESGQEDRWDSAILTHVHLDPGKLPRLTAATEVIGESCGKGAAACGLRSGIPVVAGAGDALLAAVGGGVFGARQLFGSAGTTDCLLFTGSRPPRDPTFSNCRHAIPDCWASIGSLTTAGSAVKWFCERALHCSVEEMTGWAEQAPPGAGGTVFLPYLQGCRTPWWDTNARGVLAGLGLGTGREALARAVFEGVAFGWKEIVDRLAREYALAPSEMITAGGGSANRLWNRIKASVLALPLRVLAFPETTSLGAAVLAGLGCKLFPDCVTAAAVIAPLLQDEVVCPVPSWTGVYRERYRNYVSLYPALRDTFRDRAPRSLSGLGVSRALVTKFRQAPHAKPRGN